MKSLLRIGSLPKAAALPLVLAMLIALTGCSSNQEQSQSLSPQTSQGYQTTGKTDEDVFSIDFPVVPEYKYSQEAGFPVETYVAKTDDCYVFIEVDKVTLDLEGDNPYYFAAEIAYTFLDNTVNLNITEEDIAKGALDGHPAGFVSLASQDGSSFLFGSSILGDDYVLNCIIKADTKDKLDELVKSLSVK